MTLLTSVTLWDGRSAWLTTFNTLQVLSPNEADPDLTAISCLHDFMLFISSAKLFCSTFNEWVRIKSGITTSHSVLTRTRNLCLHQRGSQASTTGLESEDTSAAAVDPLTSSSKVVVCALITPEYVSLESLLCLIWKLWRRPNKPTNNSSSLLFSTDPVANWTKCRKWHNMHEHCILVQIHWLLTFTKAKYDVFCYLVWRGEVHLLSGPIGQRPFLLHDDVQRVWWHDSQTNKRRKLIFVDWIIVSCIYRSV